MYIRRRCSNIFYVKTDYTRVDRKNGLKNKRRIKKYNFLKKISEKNFAFFVKK